MSTWYEDMLAWLLEDEDSDLMRILDAAIDAGLNHQMTWAQVQRLVECIPDDGLPCPYCGGSLAVWGLPENGCFRCRACGRLHTEGARRLDYEEPPSVAGRHYEPGARWPERLIEELTAAVKSGVCTAEEARPWLKWARSEKARWQRQDEPEQEVRVLPPDPRRLAARERLKAELAVIKGGAA